MSTEYSGSTAAWPSTVNLPSDGDEVSALVDNHGRMDLADRTAYLNAKLFTTTRMQPLVPMQGPASSINELPADWFFDAAKLDWRQASVGSALMIPIVNVPPNGKLVSLVALVNGAAGSAWSAFPSSDLPTLKLEYMDGAGVIQAPLPTATDPSTDLTSWNTVHEITCALTTPLDIDMAAAPKQMYARLDGVTGSFEPNKFGVLGLRATFTP